MKPPPPFPQLELTPPKPTSLHYPQRGLEALTRAAEKLHREMLSKSDYLPKDNTVTELQASRACLALRDLLSVHVDLLVRHLPPKDARCVRVWFHVGCAFIRPDAPQRTRLTITMTSVCFMPQHTG